MKWLVLTVFQKDIFFISLVFRYWEMNIVEENLDLMVLPIIIIHSVRAYKSEYCSNKNILVFFFSSSQQATRGNHRWKPRNVDNHSSYLATNRLQPYSRHFTWLQDQVPGRSYWRGASWRSANQRGDSHSFHFLSCDKKSRNIHFVSHWCDGIYDHGQWSTGHGLCRFVYFSSYHALSQRIEHTFYNNDGLGKRVCINVVSNSANMIHLEG